MERKSVTVRAKDPRKARELFKKGIWIFSIIFACSLLLAAIVHVYSVLI